MSEHARLRERYVAVLEGAARAHDSGDWAALEAHWRELEGSAPAADDPMYGELCIARNFCEGWLDARNHEWLHYEGLSSRDWPRLARELAALLRDGREITDERVLDHFGPRKEGQPSAWRRLVRFLGRGRSG
jgi:hypothetical protein